MRHSNDDRPKYGFLMVEFDTPDFVRKLQDDINEEELYTEEGSDDYGIERETHITLVPCLNNDVDIDKIKKFLKNIEEYSVVLTDISKFECDDFDVLKCSAKSPQFIETNKQIVDNFDTFSEYKEFKPHLTIAYMKHGMCDKYLKDILPKLVHLKPNRFHFSYYDKGGKEKHKYF